MSLLHSGTTTATAFLVFNPQTGSSQPEKPNTVCKQDPFKLNDSQVHITKEKKKKKKHIDPSFSAF